MKEGKASNLYKSKPRLGSIMGLGGAIKSKQSWSRRGAVRLWKGSGTFVPDSEHHQQPLRMDQATMEMWAVMCLWFRYFIRYQHVSLGIRKSLMACGEKV